MTRGFGHLTTITLAAIAVLSVTACGWASTTGYSDIYYDEAVNRVIAYRLTTPDYNDNYYYHPAVSVVVYGNGEVVGIGDRTCTMSEYACASLLFEPQLGVSYAIDGSHWMDIYYVYYEYDPYCSYGCYDWYDALGYSMTTVECPAYVCEWNETLGEYVCYPSFCAGGTPRVLNPPLIPVLLFASVLNVGHTTKDIPSPLPYFNADIPSSLYDYIASQGGGGGSTAAVQSQVQASGVLYDANSPLTTDNMNIYGVGALAGTGDYVNPEFENYVEQMGYSFLSPAAPSTNFASTAIPWMIDVYVTVGTTVAAGAVVIASCLLMTGDHAAGWDPSRAAVCAAQQAADMAECRRRFPYGSGQGAKYNACVSHSWLRHTKCMKNQPVPPLQPEY
jgi:hypothetical protein